MERHYTATDVPLPVSVDGLTAEWLSTALGRDVAALTVSEIIWGTATKVLITAGFGDGTEASLCVKGGFNPELLAQMGATYQVEARFYSDLGARFSAGVPTCHFAGVDERTGQGIVILDDLRSPSTTFGDARQPLTPDQVSAGLDGQAAWHTFTGHPPRWVPGTPLWQPVIDSLLAAPNWERHTTQGKAAALPAELLDRQRLQDGLHSSWNADALGPATIVHGDANVTNCVTEEGTRPWFLDWQLVCRSHWAHDVALFLVSSLSVADRREHERDLIASYVAARRDDLDVDQAFRAYRAHLLHGLMYAFIPDEMQPPEVCAPLVERFACAITDHDVLALLSTV